MDKNFTNSTSPAHHHTKYQMEEWTPGNDRIINSNILGIPEEAQNGMKMAPNAITLEYTNQTTLLTIRIDSKYNNNL